MGFCFFNNIAVAAAHARAAHGADRVLIFDWDVHHGNGTQDIFYESPHVLFVSAHQWPLYPGTGRGTEVGRGEGQGHTVNLPVPPGTGDPGYVSLAEHVVAPLIAAYRPQLVLISAGFDAHRSDPLASCVVTEEGYVRMTAALRRACDALDVPLGLVLEGGYSVEALADSVSALMPVLLAEATPDPVDVAIDDLARMARKRIEPYWPGLATP
jgi:acetoin utilization deacetylase AcuC-like enzyme